jgi:ribonucleoside-diphosphate reductase alpha chain
VFSKERAEQLLYHIKWEDLEETTRLGLRFQDAVIDSTYYPFEENERNQKSERRVGLGFMGIHDLMLLCGVRYGSEESVAFVNVVGGMIAEWAYLESVELAKENGPFPMFDRDKFLESGYMKQMAKLKPHVVEAIREHGVRNVTTMTIAPTGTTGTMVGCSTGAEPYFMWEYFRNSALGTFMENVEIVQSYLDAHPELNILREDGSKDFSLLPDYFVTAMDLSPMDHVRAQAAMQLWIDSSISKTCNAPEDFTVEQVKELYEEAYAQGCKGITIYRNNSRNEQILEVKPSTATPEPASDPIALEMAIAVEAPVVTTAVKPPVKKKRPSTLVGATYKKKTPMGAAYITINDDPDTRLAREIIVNIGKAGSEIYAMGEAIGRLATLHLKDDQSAEKEAAIVKHLSGIGGGSSVGFGPNRISSVADAVAKALIEHADSFVLRNHNFDAPKASEEAPTAAVAQAPSAEEKARKSLSDAGIMMDMCPSCNEMTLVKKAGCNECSTCGYSKC